MYVNKYFFSLKYVRVVHVPTHIIITMVCTQYLIYIIYKRDVMYRYNKICMCVSDRIACTIPGTIMVLYTICLFKLHF